MEKRPPNQAKEQLSNYLALKGKKEAILRTIETLREQAMKITMELKPDRVKNSPAIHDPIAEAAAKIADAEKALAFAAQDATAAMNDTIRLILSVEGDKLQTLLLLRYIQGEQWDTIAHALHYERRQIHRMHGQALEQINRRQDRGTANHADG